MKKGLFLLSVFALFVAACKKTKPPEEEVPVNSYDQKPMFQNYSANLIVPSYNLLKEKLDSLNLAIQNFNSSTTEINLNLARAAYMKAYKQYMYCSTYEFGPAATIIFRSSTNIFPTDTTQINSNIAAGTYDFTMASQTDAIGFPAMDFILYGYNKTATSITNLFSTNVNRRQYLLDLCTDLQTKTNTVITGWSSYTTTFNNATGNAAGNSLSNLVNEFNYDYEITKNARVGIPLGKQTLGIAMPEKVEAFYSGNSLILLKEKVNALEGIYLGRSQSGINGTGLDDYLTYLNSQYAGGSLNAAIQTKFVELKALVDAIPETLSNSVISSAASVDLAYQKFQELLVLLKTDMPSALSVYITYVDGDGD
jgi:uncharacterized protein